MGMTIFDPSEQRRKNTSQKNLSQYWYAYIHDHGGSSKRCGAHCFHGDQFKEVVKHLPAREQVVSWLENMGLRLNGAIRYLDEEEKGFLVDGQSYYPHLFEIIIPEIITTPPMRAKDERVSFSHMKARSVATNGVR